MNKEAFEIVFNDDYLVVVNKIAKILIHPSPRKEKYTLTYLLEKKLQRKLYPCHRLDRQTSGLIIYAKTKIAERKIMEEFRRGEVKKAYWAFVKGRLNRKKGVLKGYILDKEGERFRERPKEAKSFYKVLKEYNNFSIIELIPLTGRTNQLRIQLAHLGHPILGERKYALGRDFKVKFRRLALHAFYLNFIHPVSRERIELKIDLAKDMKEFLSAFAEDHWLARG